MSKKRAGEERHKQDDREALAEHQMRMRFDWSNLIEDLIQDGLERGAFDDLQGKGKPLDLKKSPYGAEWELAHKLMKENDVLPPWIARRNEIAAQIDHFRAEVRRAWIRHEQAFRYAQAKGHKDALSLSWDDVCRQWELDLGVLNKQIRDFNLGRPIDNVEMFELELKRELDSAGAKRYLA
jgi:hypothetical protein